MLVLPWLAVCTVFDLRTRSVPTWLSIPPLLAAIAWTAWLGEWAVCLLALTLIALDDVPFRLRGFLGGLQGLLLLFAWLQGGQPALILGLVLIGLWLFWKLGAYGGADAQALMTLALFFQPAVLIPIAAAGGIQGLVQWQRGKQTLPAMLAILAGTGIHILSNYLQTIP